MSKSKHLTDIEIARSAKKQPIQEIANKLGISDRYLEPFGKYKGKVSLDFFNKLKASDAATKMEPKFYSSLLWS